MPEQVRHRLMAILAADAVGYSRSMSVDDLGTLGALDAARRVFQSHIETVGGRVVDTSGDSILAVFDTAIGAVRAAIEIQQELSKEADASPNVFRLLFRIGIHVGDLIEKSDGTVYGDGVNIASRLQAVAEPGGVVVSHAVAEFASGRIDAAFQDIGEQTVKNIAKPIAAFRLLRVPGLAESTKAQGSRDSKPVALATGAHQESGHDALAGPLRGARRIPRWRWMAMCLLLVLVAAVGTGVA